MALLNILLIVAALWGFAFTLYCQTKARGYISREKLKRVKNPRRALKVPMPPRAILEGEGLKFYKGYYFGISLFAICIILLLVINSLYR